MTAPWPTATDPTDPTRSTRSTCLPADRVTKSLLGYGVIAGPCYLAVALAQALLRDGFELSRHSWSLLANGDRGWIQVANFILTGLMVIAFAAGLDRAVEGGPGAAWAPRLIGVFGVSMIAAGLFRADPAAGFPVGSPAGSPPSWPGLVHLAAGGIGFTCLAIACLRLAARYRGERRSGFAAFSAVTGIVFLAAFLALAGSGGAPAATLAFVGAVVLVWTWMTMVAIDQYRTVAARSR